MTTSQVLHLALGAVVLLALTGLVLRLGQVRIGLAPYVAVARGAVQLTVVALALHGALTVPAVVVAVLAVMFAVAVWTATRRLVGVDGAPAAVPVACASGAGAVLVLVFVLGVLPFSARYVVALGGIVIGGTMTAATLAGRNFRRGLLARREEVEGWLALGATPREAAADVARDAAAEALVPGLDQTRTTGLVTLPGAFIGALLGGASPAQAARFQLVVLVALITAQAIVAVVLVRLVGAPATVPEAGIAPAPRVRRHG